MVRTINKIHNGTVDSDVHDQWSMKVLPVGDHE